jgi:hypothetical protein
MRCVLIIFTALALAGCDSVPTISHSSPLPPRPTTTETITTTTRATPSTVLQTTTVAAPIACSAAQLGLRYITEQGTTGSLIMTFAFINEGTTPCTLVGYPGLSVYTPQPLDLAVAHDTTRVPKTVLIRPAHQQPFIVVVYPDTPSLGNCQQVKSFSFIPPNTTTSIAVKHLSVICGAQATISAVGYSGG